MPFLKKADREFLEVFSQLAYCNPFEPKRIELEQAALGARFQADTHSTWSRTAASSEVERPNVVQLTAMAEEITQRLRESLAEGADASPEEVRLYEDAVTYVLYYRWFAALSPAGLSGHRTAITAAWNSFAGDFSHFFNFLNDHRAAEGPSWAPEHLFACLHQLRRAFRAIFDCILGESLPAARLRAMVWQSIFTHDMRRYRRGLYNRMADLATLVTGPSGTGKELVAKAIAESQYVAFDATTQSLAGKPQEGFLPINLSALSPTLIESELFGHCRGAFTGALSDRSGWLESCPAHGAVFLDEIGELEGIIQVKLLRVVQARVYTRLGETNERTFAGKIVAATNRDLAAEMQAGRFRQDLYYRLCSDRIQTPSLREQLDDRPEALNSLVELIAERVAGEESGPLAEETLEWIAHHLPADYPWPGNIRELEQCVRNVMIRQQYAPRTDPPKPSKGVPEWLDGVERGELTADELVRRYCTATYARLDNYERTAKALGLDRRTVRAKVDADLLRKLRDAESTE